LKESGIFEADNFILFKISVKGIFSAKPFLSFAFNKLVTKPQ